METKYTRLELARIFGEPLDPRKPYPNVVDKVCETDTAEPNEYQYFYDTTLESDVIHTITNTGAVTTVNVLPTTPAALTFIAATNPLIQVNIVSISPIKSSIVVFIL